ncbi:MAG: hypothetical protein M0Z84_07935 [Gammaproteobacteria bacterium]|nr:hypothetical protein [Gammaproteobacteria bacterium]
MSFGLGIETLRPFWHFRIGLPFDAKQRHQMLCVAALKFQDVAFAVTNVAERPAPDRLFTIRWRSAAGAPRFLIGLRRQASHE